MFNKTWWFLHFQNKFLNFSFCMCKLAVAFYMIDGIWPKRKFQNIVQCPFKKPFDIIMGKFNPFFLHLYLVLKQVSGVTTGCILPIGQYCNLEVELCYLKNLKMFNCSERIIWTYSLAKRWQVFAFFLSIFLRNQSLSNRRGLQ